MNAKRCKAKSKYGHPCGNYAVRKGLCLYHQPEEKTRRLLAALDRNERERQEIVRKLQANRNAQ